MLEVYNAKHRIDLIKIHNNSVVPFLSYIVTMNEIDFFLPNTLRQIKPVITTRNSQ